MPDQKEPKADQYESRFSSSGDFPGATNRRHENLTDISCTSSLEVALHRNLMLEERLKDDDTAEETPEQTLKRLLSTKSGISTKSAFAERQRAAIGTNPPFREIGTGSIGKVYEQAGTIWAFKLPLLDHSQKLWNNYIMHLRIQSSFDQLGHLSGKIEIPRAARFANETPEFWPKNIDLFPDERTFLRRPCQVLCMERIFPLPESIRNTLINIFCPSSNVDRAMNDKANKDCLIRPFLGRSLVKKSRPGGSIFFSLRNFKLHLDQIKDLDLDAESYAISMADAIATLHWHTKIDGMDIEFVIGSSPIDDKSVRRAMPLGDIQRLQPGTSTYEHTTNSDPNFNKRVISLWLLDFDACNDITVDDNGVQQAVKAFLQTDPYYPRPLSQDHYAEHLWKTFSERYQETSMKLVEDTGYIDLPDKFIRGVVAELSGRQELPVASVGRGSGNPAVQSWRGNRRGSSSGGGSSGSVRGLGKR